MPVTSIRATAAALAIIALCLSAARPHGQIVESSRQRMLGPVPLEEAVRRDNVFGYETSPDGTLVAYKALESWRRQRTGDAWFLPSGVGTVFSGARIRLADLGSGRLLPLGDEAQARWASWAPAWAPDGKSLAFVSDRDGHPRVWLWNRQSGRITRVSDAIVLDPVRRVTMEAWRLLQWTPDGRAVVVRLLPEDMTLSDVVEYSRVGAGRERSDERSERGATVTMYPRPATRAEGQGELGEPGTLFMGRHKHFLCDLASIDVEAGKVKRLARRVHTERYDLAPDGRHLAFYDLATLRIVETSSGREVVTDHAPPGDVPNTDLRWAPTSDYVVHLVSGALRRVDVAGTRGSMADVRLKELPAWNREAGASLAPPFQQLARGRGCVSRR